MLYQKDAVFQGVLDSMQDMLRVLDLNGRVVLVNKSYERCFGAQTGKPCYNMYRRDVPCRICIGAPVYLNGQTAQKNIRHGGRAYSVSASPLYGGDGGVTGTVEVFRDITETLREEKRLREQNKRLLHEARLAARMQKNLFLSQGMPDTRVSMSSRYLPASSIGGDMFGCLRQEDGRLCFYVADVSGHGVAAAMITLFLANILRRERFCSAAEMLTYARAAFLSLAGGEQLYVSMFAAILAPDSGELIFANAGLNAVPLLVHEGSAERLYSPALPLCDWEDDIRYEDHTRHMPEGARLLLYTDGLVDGRSSRLSEGALERRALRMEGEALMNSLERQVLHNRSDDVCMLLVTRNTTAAI